MEFWGVEVKSGEPLTCQPGEGRVVHLSQACIGETKKDKSNESVVIYVTIGEKKLVLGTLTPEKLPQQTFDLIFDQEFQLSHKSKFGSVYFVGYSAPQPIDDSGSESEDEMFSDEELPREVEMQDAVVAKSEPKKIAKVEKAKKEVKPETDDSDDDSESDDDMSGSDSDIPLQGELGSDSDEDDESDDEEESEEEEETPKAVPAVKNKKRPNEAVKTPVPDKKAKLATPKKSDGKKGEAHVDTPHPKQGVKKDGDKSNQKSAEGSVKCDTCKRPFKSEFALGAHTKAKHSAGK